MTSPDALLLDDHAMSLLAQMAAAYSDLEAAREHGEMDEAGTIVLTGNDGPVGSITFEATDTRERRALFWDLTQDFISHVHLLGQHRDIPIRRQLDWHITLDASAMALVDHAQVNPRFDPIDRVILCMIPIFRQLQTRNAKDNHNE